MRKSDFDPIREARERDLQVRTLSRQMLEGLPACRDDGGLQLSNGMVLDPGGIGEIASHAAGCRSQARVGVNLQMEDLEFSGHGCWLAGRRRLRGNQDSNRVRPHKGARLPDPCR